MACGLLGIFVGGLGIHNFMLGYTGKAVAQLCLYVGGWLFSWLLIGIPAIMAAGIWGLIDGIMILSNKEYRDAAGNLLSD
jgi:TM2 domain-containing membrane protein YozV